MLLEKRKKECVHTRNIKISTFENDQGGIIVEGELIEDGSNPVIQQPEKNDRP